VVAQVVVDVVDGQGERDPAPELREAATSTSLSCSERASVSSG
jgi:hypothetical protein